MSCAECEAMLTDFIDGTLSVVEKVAFDLHIATCKDCSQMLADARRGAALLEMLKSPRPEPSSALLDRILAQTSGVMTSTNSSPAATMLGLSVVEDAAGNSQNLVPATAAGVLPIPAAIPSHVLPFRTRIASGFDLRTITRSMMQPRLAMTAAMAFFSVALTMNLTGVHFSEFKASDLKPSNIRHSFYQADASLVRYYDNLRVVYELESRVSDLKQSSDSDSPSANGKTNSNGDSNPNSDKSGQDGDQKRAQPKAGSGTSQRRSPMQQEFRLADERFGQRSDRDTSIALLRPAGLRETSFVEPNKSNDALQEGGLV